MSSLNFQEDVCIFNITTTFISSIQMIYHERMKYIESATLCFLFYARAFTSIPGCECNTFASKKHLLEAAKTTGKIAAFSIHSNALILARDIFINVSPLPPHPKSCLGAWWLSGIVLEMRSNGSGFETHWRHCIESLSKTLDFCLSKTENRT